MRHRDKRLVLVSVAASISLAGCDLINDRIEVPTRDEVHQAGPREECGAWGAGQPVQGNLEIVRDGERAETFVLTAAGERLYVVWPSGFSATSAEGGTILDDQGIPIFHHGEELILDQVDRRVAAGTIDDPLVATGIVAGRCFVPGPERL